MIKIIESLFILKSSPYLKSEMKFKVVYDNDNKSYYVHIIVIVIKFTPNLVISIRKTLRNDLVPLQKIIWIKSSFEIYVNSV